MPTLSKSQRMDPAHRTPDGLLRRIPRQERGRERVDRVLDAAASVIAEVGVEAATTNAIAARAQTSVGSLYQFFPNKDAIVNALAARYNKALRRINDKSISFSVSPDLEDAIEQIMAPFVDFYMENPAYRHVYHALHHPEVPSCEETELHRAVTFRTELFLSQFNPTLTSEERHMQATVAVLAAHGVLSYAMRANPATRDGIVAMLKRFMCAFVKDIKSPSPSRFSFAPVPFDSEQL